jgi:hypothetical protein
MARPWLGGTLLLSGIGVVAIGSTEPTIIGCGARPYAYVSAMAVGAMLIIAGALLWRDR